MNTTEKRFQAAMAAMQGLCANPDFTSSSERQIAEMAVEHADALLAELDRTETKQPEPTIPAPPKGFTLWGTGPLKPAGKSYISASIDIAVWNGQNRKWEENASGTRNLIYALRDGSEIQRLNGRVKP